MPLKKALYKGANIDHREQKPVTCLSGNGDAMSNIF